MKNQYVGDVGDFGKYALLRAFDEAGVRVGVNWYLTEDDGSNDGKFTNYLKDESMRNCCPEVFDALSGLVKKPKKSVADIRKSGIIKNALFYEKLLKPEGTPVQRIETRNNWFHKSEKALSDAELIFMDPDNGLLASNEASKQGAEKYILPDEAERYFRSGHNVVYYCHKGRRTAKLWKEYKNIMFERIPEAKPIILTFHKGSQRSYVFMIHKDDFMGYRKIIDEFLSGWAQIFTEDAMVGKYPVITLCGSTRFKNEFMEAQKRLTLEGNIVISVGLFGRAGDPEVWDGMDEGTLSRTKEMLDDMHKCKIDMADGIYVINVDGYIGESTRSEIEYAKAHGKEIKYLFEPIDMQA